MANAVYPKYREALIQGLADSDLDGSGTTGVYVAAVDTGVYTYNAAHDFYDDLGASVIGTPVELAAAKTYVNGLFDAADVTLVAVTGASVEALVLYRRNAGANTTWRLISYLDTGVTGLPFTPSGADVLIAWHASGIIQF